MIGQFHGRTQDRGIKKEVTPTPQYKKTNSY